MCSARQLQHLCVGWWPSASWSLVSRKRGFAAPALSESFPPALTTTPPLQLEDIHSLPSPATGTVPYSPHASASTPTPFPRTRRRGAAAAGGLRGLLPAACCLLLAAGTSRPPAWGGRACCHHTTSMCVASDVPPLLLAAAAEDMLFTHSFLAHAAADAQHPFPPPLHLHRLRQLSPTPPHPLLLLQMLMLLLLLLLPPLCPPCLRWAWRQGGRVGRSSAAPATAPWSLCAST